MLSFFFWIKRERERGRGCTDGSGFQLEKQQQQGRRKRRRFAVVESGASDVSASGGEAASIQESGSGL
jgi:hypothetical protein